MNKVKIAVIKSSIDEKLKQEYGKDTMDVCPVFNVGQEFICDTSMPEGFCQSAWMCLKEYVFAIVHGGDQEYFYGDDNWVKEKGSAIVCCNDGLRPVVFKVERYK